MNTRWRLLTDVPRKTGRYCVAHRGQTFGSAYYTANEGDTHYPVGWAQMPSFKPTHWLDNVPKFPDKCQCCGNDLTNLDVHIEYEKDNPH